MKKRIISLLLILVLCLPPSCAHALVVQIGDEAIILDDSVLENTDGSEMTVITEGGTLLENGDILIPTQIPNAQWLYSQLETIDQAQLLQDIIAAMYLINCLQSREMASSQNISVASLEDFLNFFFDGDAELRFEGDDLCCLALSNEAYIKFYLEDAYITSVSLCLSGIENAYGEAMCVDFALQ